MIIRAVTDADRPAWDALYAAYAQFYDVAQTPDMRARVWGWLHDPAHQVNGIVADVDGVIVGIAHFRPFARPLAASTGMYLDDLYVLPAARGTGAAGALIDTIKVDATARGHSTLRWFTNAGNARARGLYDKVAVAGDWITYDIEL